MQITAIALIAATAVAHMGWGGDEHSRDMTGFKGQSMNRMGRDYSAPIEVIEVAIDEYESIDVVVDNADDLDIDMDEVIDAAIEVAIYEDVDEVEVVVEEVVDEEGYSSAEVSVRGVERRAFNEARKTYRETRPTFASYQPESLDFGLGAGEEYDGNWWSSMEAMDAEDIDIMALRSDWRDARSEWRDGRPAWDSWSA